MVSPQPDHDPAIQGFYQWVKGVRSMGSGDTQVVCNRPFVSYKELEDYFSNQYHVKKLLRVLFGDGAEPPVEPDQIRGKYSKVFFILLLIGKGCYIAHFIRHDDLCDQRLPFKTIPDDFPISPPGHDFFDSFCQKQWECCAPIFHNNMNKIFGVKEVLPIILKERLGSGGSATTFKVSIHPAYDQLSKNRNTKKEINDQLANTYVLKTYETKEAETYYTNEVNAFRELRNEPNSPNLIGFYGSFIQNGTYNVLLEYADEGDLENYFKTRTPPSRGGDIIRFWRGLFGILNALDLIHNVPRSALDGPHFLQGWHQDVKPANILVKSSLNKSAFECQFKLADLGLSHFIRTVSPNANATSKDTHGTEAYGAPECYRVNDLVDRQPIQVTPSVDIYSLGCVYSEAAIWVVRGWDGLQEYRRQRRIETQKIADFRATDCFHNGETTLDMVGEMHEDLIQDCKRSDYVTEAALNLIKDMLEAEAGRPSARNLYYKSNRILAAAQNKLKGSAGGRSADRMSNPQFSMHDRPKTPPQVPDGYKRPHSRISHDYGPFRNGKSLYLESPPYPNSDSGHPPYNFNPTVPPARKSSKGSPPFDRHEESGLTRTQLYDQAASDDDHKRSVSLSSPVSSKNGYANPDRSRIQRQGTSNGKKSRSNSQAGAYMAADPLTDPGVLDREVTFTNGNSRQYQLPASSAACCWEDTGRTTELPHSCRQESRTISPVTARYEAIESPLTERLGISHATASPALKKLLPTLSVPDAQNWKIDMKNRIKTSLPYDYLFNSLNRRDHAS